MKNIITIVAVCLITVGANAQKVTEKDLLGTWKLISIDFYGNYYDFKTDSLTISKKLIEQKPNLSTETIRNDLLKMIKLFKGTVTFEKGLVVTYNLEERILPYRQQHYIVENGDKQFLKDDKGLNAEIYIQNGILYWIVNSTKGEGKMIYEKIK